MQHYEMNPANLPKDANGHHDYAVFRDVKIPMRDGAELCANIFFPTKNGVVDLNRSYDVFLNRSPYFTTSGELTVIPPFMDIYAAEQDCALVLCSCRGTYKYIGTFEPLRHEGKDSVDTVNWLLKQPWCSGKVATFGSSYLGGNQYLMHLEPDVPNVAASAINVPGINFFGGGMVYSGDFFDMNCEPVWGIMMALDYLKNHRLPEEVLAQLKADDDLLGNPIENQAVVGTIDFNKLQAEYGLKNIPILRHMPFYQDFLAHRDDPDFFEFANIESHTHATKTPLLFIGGWYDLFGENTVRGYEKSVEDAPSEEVAKSHRLIMGPWTHSQPVDQRFPNALLDLRAVSMEFIQQYMSCVESRFFQEVPVAIYVMGENQWRSEQAWPIKDTQLCSLYLHSDGKANSVHGTGVLSSQPPKQEKPDCYLADPANPVVAVGGIAMYGGQEKQTETELRQDVMVYTSEELSEDMEVTGYIRASFYAATTATDTDFMIRIVDVDPDGTAWNVVNGGRRGRYVKNGRANPCALTPGEIVKYEIKMRPTSYVFKRGHRIRVDICSSDVKFFDSNPNAFVDLNTATSKDFVVATQTIYHDDSHPAVIELPIIPDTHERNWIEWPFDADKIKGLENWLAFWNPPTINPPIMKEAEELPTV